jgi:hypothetical protein
LKTSGEFIKGTSIRMSLAPDPLNELADDHYDVIEDAVLIVDVVEASPNGIGINSAGTGLNIRNYPNPFAGYTTIEYTLPFNGNVMLEIRNSLGMVVEILVNELQTSGKHSLKFDASVLPSGVYTASIRLSGKSDELIKTIKMVNNK